LPTIPTSLAYLVDDRETFHAFPVHTACSRSHAFVGEAVTTGELMISGEQRAPVDDDRLAGDVVRRRVEHRGRAVVRNRAGAPGEERPFVAAGEWHGSGESNGS
jgi:hypothetical protein